MIPGAPSVTAESSPAAHCRRQGGVLLESRSAADEAIAYARAARTRFVRELAELIRFPTVSAQPRHNPDLQRCAMWLADHLQTIGLEHVRVVRTPGHPIVTADWLHANRDFTLLVYGHYDVQPADPLPKWESPPFEPQIRGGYLYGRGASDDKGQMFVHVKALESWMRTRDSLPINVKCVFEGEEEIGSASLQDFLSTQIDAWQADAAIVSDMWMLAPGHPAITESLRGALSVELEVTGPEHDVHSGNFGGAIHNPLQALCEIVAKLHGPRGRVAIPGFYDCVRMPTREERAEMARFGPPDRQILRAAGAERGWGAPGFSLYERIAIRPALSVNGLVGGYTGPGAKAVIPARAYAKINFRLVPEQDPADIDRSFRRFLKQIAPSTVAISVRTLFRAHPFVLHRDDPVVRAAREALRKGFGRSPGFRAGRRNDSDRTCPPEGTGHPDHSDRSRPAGRPDAWAERKVSSGQFLAGIEASIHLLAELEMISSEPDLARS